MPDTHYIYYSSRRLYVENQRDERLWTRFFHTSDPVVGPAQVLAMQHCIRSLAQDFNVPVERIHPVGQTAILLIGRAADILAASDRPGGTVCGGMADD